MSPTPQSNSPATRQHADARLRRLTRAAALVATGATIAIGVVVAKEHPGASAPSKTAPVQVPSTTSPSTATPTSPSPPTTTTTTSAPTKTKSAPIVTSGGTSR